MSSRAGLAAVLSFVIPGLGQIYNGTFIRAAFWIFFVAIGWIAMFWNWPADAGFWQWTLHFIPALTAYSKARQVELIIAWKAEMERRVGGDSNSGRTFDQ
jgi:hypothetical protein